MVNRVIVWTMGGSDCSAGAGVQQDLATFTDLGVYGCSIVTVLTAQNSQTLKMTEYCSANMLYAQISALNEDLPPQVIKLGALGNSNNVQAIGQYLKSYQGKVIFDPVLAASVGGDLLEVEAIKSLTEAIFPKVTLLTPNISEAEILLNKRINTRDDVKKAAHDFLAMGVKNVLIKGGHFKDSIAADYFCNQENSFWLQSPKLINKKEVHGTGCILSAAIVAAIGLGYDLYDALVIAKMYVNQAIRHSFQLGKGSLFSSHQGWPNNMKDLPWISKNLISPTSNFPDLGAGAIGFYPIVDSVSWIEKLISQGVRTIQLRIKNLAEEKVEKMVKESVALAKAHNVRLFINDYWGLAIKYKAYGVHLGQEDLQTVDLDALKKSKIRLGISTHCFYEVARAHTCRPSYVAFGPIYETKTKAMKFSPRGLQQLAYWRQVLSYPLIAIGGINLERLTDVLAIGVDGVSVISAITKSTDYCQAAQKFLEKIEKRKYVES